MKKNKYPVNISLTINNTVMHYSAYNKLIPKQHSKLTLILHGFCRLQQQNINPGALFSTLRFVTFSKSFNSIGLSSFITAIGNSVQFYISF